VDVKAETLKHAAELLILRRDTLRLIDGAGASVAVSQSESTSDEAHVDETDVRSSAESEHPSDPHDEQAHVSNAVGNSVLSAKPGKCTFSGIVPIDLKRFEESGVALVECPDCGRTWTLSPRGGVLRFKSHDKRNW
jgi:hypothetical protein